tara:strand:- start:157 stop:543 length:387 start_codon:yes stop_codon:yes gene_type:complete
MATLGVWMQVNLLQPIPQNSKETSNNNPDYYIHNFLAVGRDVAGVVYKLKGERLVHYPEDNASLLDYPEISQFQKGRITRKSSSNSGWLSNEAREILLTENVVVTHYKNEKDPGSVTKTNRLIVRLER